MLAYHSKRKIQRERGKEAQRGYRDKKTQVVSRWILFPFVTFYYTMDIEEFFKNCRNVLDAHVNDRHTEGMAQNAY